MSEATQGGEITKDAKTMAMLAHLLGIVLGFIGPLIIWLIKKDEHPFIDDQGKEALNFQITMLIPYVISSILTVACIGAVLLPLFWLVAVVFGILAGVAANKGEAYRYPVCLRLIK